MPRRSDRHFSTLSASSASSSSSISTNTGYGDIGSDCNKPLPSLPSKRKKASILGTLKRLPQALQGKRVEECSLQRRPAVRVKVQRRETFVMQTPDSPPRFLPDPACLGNFLLVGAQQRRSLARTSRPPHVTQLSSLSAIPEDSPFGDVFLNRSSSTISSTTPSLTHSASSANSGDQQQLTASPRSYFSDDSEEEEGGDLSDDDHQDFPEEASEVDDNLDPDLDINSFVSTIEDDRRWSSIFDVSPPSSVSSPPSTRPSSPFSVCTSPSPPSEITYVSPRLSSSSSFAPFEHGFRNRPPPIRTLHPGVGADGTYDLDDFKIILTEQPPSPQRKKFGRRASLPHPPLPHAARDDRRRGSA
ncbi:hypothetical protein JCM11641_003694 [Rhodosporidiobolus odoratus]